MKIEPKGAPLLLAALSVLLAGSLAWLINALAVRDKWATEAWGSRTYGLDAIASP